MTTTTEDADVILLSGLFCYSSAAEMETMVSSATDVDVATTVVSGLSSCFSSADVAMTDADATTTSANSF